MQRHSGVGPECNGGVVLEWNEGGMMNSSEIKSEE